jgi:exopolysaccharide production protein ExoQ
MPPPVALALYCVFVLALLRYDPAKGASPPLALWVPVIWLVIIMSRLPSQWFGVTADSAAEALQDGNWLDRGVYLLLMVLAIRILATRSLAWGGLVSNNASLALLVLFGLVSVTWSDFPGVSLRRWIRDLGQYLMVMVVLSDPRPLAAIETVVRRVCYILLPMSVVLIKYYRRLGVGYDSWTGTVSYQGVSTSKNGLGALCLIAGIFFVWDTARRWPRRWDRIEKWTMLVNVTFLVITLWLLNLARSATSWVCLLVASLVILAVHVRPAGPRQAFLKFALPASFGFYVALDLLIGVTDLIASALGRDSTLTGRTEVWQVVSSLTPSYLLGAGYASFWLGDRLSALWTRFGWRPYQAHNGYLEVYLNLGAVGLTLLVVFLLNSYRRIWRPGKTLDFLSLSLAIWTVTLLRNMTEASFLIGPQWVLLLLGSVVVPGRTVPAVRTATEVAVKRWTVFASDGAIRR